MPRDEEDELPETEEPDEPSPPPTQSKSKAKKSAAMRHGVGAPPDDAPRDACELWEWILADLERKGISPHQVRIAVYQVDPPSPAGGEFSVGFIPGGSVLGDGVRDPGQALFDYVVNNFHLTRPASRTGVRYSMRFSWATNNQQFKRGALTLPPASEIMAVRAEMERQRQSTQQPEATGVGQAPPTHPPPMAPGYGYPMPPWMQQPPQQPQGFGSNEQMLALIGEMWRASMEQRPPVMPAGMQPPPGMAAPPINEQALTERVTASVVMALKQLGVLDRPQPQTIAAPPPPPKPAGVADMMEKMVFRMFEAAAGEVERSVKKTIAGVGKPPEDDEPDERPAMSAGGSVPLEPPPEEALPFRIRPVPEAKWADGRTINYADDEDGNISIPGMLAGNPIIVEKGMDVVVGLGAALKDFVGRMGTQASAPLGKPPSAPPQQLPPSDGRSQNAAPTPTADERQTEPATPSWKE